MVSSIFSVVDKLEGMIARLQVEEDYLDGFMKNIQKRRRNLLKICTYFMKVCDIFKYKLHKIDLYVKKSRKLVKNIMCWLKKDYSIISDMQIILYYLKCKSFNSKIIVVLKKRCICVRMLCKIVKHISKLLNWKNQDPEKEI